MRIKGYIYTILLVLIILNVKNLNIHSTHFFSELIITIGALVIIGMKIAENEKEQNYSKLGRMTFISLLIAYGFYELEGYLLK